MLLASRFYFISIGPSLSAISVSTKSKPLSIFQLHPHILSSLIPTTSTYNASSHHIKELVKVDLIAADVVNHLVHHLVLVLVSERLHGSLELTGIDRARTISVKERKGFLEFVDFLLAQTGSTLLFSTLKRGKG